MNLIKLITNQTEKTISFCLISFLFIVFCAVSVFYVNAAEIHLEEESRENETWEKPAVKSAYDGKNRFEKEITLPAAFWGTNNVASRLQDMERIRMANEDAIQVAHTLPLEPVLSEKEYNILTRIVEAEAGNLDKKSKILVANVILNRMDHEEFPDTVEEVVFQNVNGAVQFSPIADGRYYTVKVAESTKESVDRALAGEDYSEGALYFMERSISAASNVEWFDNNLVKLFKYQSHEFFK